MREERRCRSMDMPSPAASSVSWKPDAEQPPAKGNNTARRTRFARSSSMGFGAHTQNGSVATKSFRSITTANANGSTQGRRVQRTWTMSMGTTFGNGGAAAMHAADDAEPPVVVLRGEAIPGLVQELSNGNTARHRCARSSSMGFGGGAHTQNGTVATKSYKSVTATHASGSTQGRVQRSWTIGMGMATTFGNQGKKAQAAGSASHISTTGARQSISIPSEPMTFEQRDKIMSKVALNRKQVHDHVMSSSPEEWKEMQAKLRQTKARTNAGLAMAMDCHLLDAALEQSKNRRRHKEQQNIINDTAEVADDDDKKENASFEKQETASTSITAVAAGQATPGISACGIRPSLNASASSTRNTAGDSAPYALHLVRSNSQRFGLVSQSLLHDLRRASFTADNDEDTTSTTSGNNSYSLLQRLHLRPRSCHAVVETKANTDDVKRPQPPTLVSHEQSRAHHVHGDSYTIVNSRTRWFPWKRSSSGAGGRGAHTASPPPQTVDENNEHDDPQPIGVDSDVEIASGSNSVG
jgi:hypothetical protein